jgi:hypothetical protein
MLPRGRLYVFASVSDSHFMNTESTIRMYREHLGPTFRRRRQDLFLEGQRGGIIFDAFSGNEGRSSGEDAKLTSAHAHEQNFGSWA